MIQIIRHGQALHNVIRPYPYRDPPLTDIGEEAAKHIEVITPDLIVISPMTRTIQTAMIAFPSLIGAGVDPLQVEVQIWPELREAYEAECCKGLSRSAMTGKFPQLDFSRCSEEWDYEPHSVGDTVKRAEVVRERLLQLSKTYKNIAIVSHRGFLAYLVQGDRFELCESRIYTFGEGERMALNCDTEQLQDFGPTLLVPSR